MQSAYRTFTAAGPRAPAPLQATPVSRRLASRVAHGQQRRPAAHLICRVAELDVSISSSANVTDGDDDAWEEEEEEEDDTLCPVFTDRDGNMIEVMCCDYGFRTGTGRVKSGYGKIPKSAWRLAMDNFNQEWNHLRRSFKYDEYKQYTELNPAKTALGKVSYAIGNAIVKAFAVIDSRLEQQQLFAPLLPDPLPRSVTDSRTGSMSSACKDMRTRLKQLVLSNDAVWKREHIREAQGGGVDTPWFVRGVYLALCLFLDFFYDNRPIQRFWFLEQVARMPYMSYISMLHLYESLGWWRVGAELRTIHFAEEWNELHHSQIMEALGGDQLWIDRFAAQHAAIIYYWVLIGLFAVSPKLAYNFSELIEAHAVDTYGEFADANEELLKQLPPPLIAVEYYLGSETYLFDSFQTSRKLEPRRPPCNNLYDVFCNIRDDEGEHVKTMAACQDESIIFDLEARRELPRNM